MKKTTLAICSCLLAVSATFVVIRHNYEPNPEVTVEAVLLDKWVDVRGKYKREYLMGLYREVGGKERLYERSMSSYNYHKVDTGTVFDLKMRKSEYERSAIPDLKDIGTFLGMIMPIVIILAMGFIYSLTKDD